MLRFRLREFIGRWEVEHGRSLSFDELADFTSVSRQVLAKMADPRGYVTASRHIEELCHFFKVTPNELIVFDCPIGTPRKDRPNISAETDPASNT